MSTLIVVGVTALVSVAFVAVVMHGLKGSGGATRRAKKQDAVQTIAKVNKGGYLDDMGTIKIDPGRLRKDG